MAGAQACDCWRAPAPRQWRLPPRRRSELRPRRPAASASASARSIGRLLGLATSASFSSCHGGEIARKPEARSRGECPRGAGHQAGGDHAHRQGNCPCRGFAPRRDAETWIEQGRVQRHGAATPVPCREPVHVEKRQAAAENQSAAALALTTSRKGLVTSHKNARRNTVFDTHRRRNSPASFRSGGST